MHALFICVVWLMPIVVQSFVFRSFTPSRKLYQSITVEEPLCKLDQVLSMFLSNPNITEEIKQKRFSQSEKFRKKPLPSFLSENNEVIVADITAAPLFCNTSIFFTNITMGSSIELFDEEYDALGKNRSLPVFNLMLTLFYEKFTGCSPCGIEIRIQNLNYAFKALIYSEFRTKCISIKLWSLDEVDSMLYRRQHCGEFAPIVNSIFHRKKVKKIGQKKLRAIEEARKAAEKKEKKKQKALARQQYALKYPPKKKAPKKKKVEDEF